MVENLSTATKQKQSYTIMILFRPYFFIPSSMFHCGVGW